jgi:hypothetical protein
MSRPGTWTKAEFAWNSSSPTGLVAHVQQRRKVSSVLDTSLGAFTIDTLSFRPLVERHVRNKMLTSYVQLARLKADFIRIPVIDIRNEIVTGSDVYHIVASEMETDKFRNIPGALLMDLDPSEKSMNVILYIVKNVNTLKPIDWDWLFKRWTGRFLEKRAVLVLPSRRVIKK